MTKQLALAVGLAAAMTMAMASAQSGGGYGGGPGMGMGMGPGMGPGCGAAQGTADCPGPGSGYGPGYGRGHGFGGQGMWLLTPEERLAFRDAMHAVKTVDECNALLAQQHEIVAQRAKEKGIAVPAGGPRPGMCERMKARGFIG